MLSPILPKIAAPIAETAAESTLSKYCCDWKQCAILAALVVSVVGVAACIFEASLFGVIGFLALGGFTLVFRSLNNNELINFETQLTEKETQDAKEMADLSEKMGKDVASLEQNSKTMDVQVEKLKTDLAQREALEKKLAEEKEQFATQVHTLTDTKTALEGDLKTMKEKSLEIEKKIQALMEENLKLGTTLGAFKKEVGGISQNEEAMKASVQKFQVGFDGDLDALNKELDLGKTTATELMTNIHDEKVKVEDALKASIDERGKVKEEMDAEIARLKLEQDALNKTVEALQKQKTASEEIIETLRKEDGDIIKDTKELNASKDGLLKAMDKRKAEYEALGPLILEQKETTVDLEAKIKELTAAVEKLRIEKKTLRT